MSEGSFHLEDAAFLLGVSEERVERACAPGPTGEPPLVRCESPDRLTFDELVALSVAMRLVDDTSVQEVRRTLARLREAGFGENPFSTRAALEVLRLAPPRLLIEDGSSDHPVDAVTLQESAKPIIGRYLTRVEFDSDGRASRWVSNDQSVELRPDIQGGAPCISGTRVSTDVVRNMVDNGMELQDVADDLWLDVSEIEAALRFEASPVDSLLAQTG